MKNGNQENSLQIIVGLLNKIDEIFSNFISFLRYR